MEIARTTDAWEDDQEPERRPARRRRFEDDDDYVDDLDISHGRSAQPHRGGAVLTFGILSLLVCGPIFGPIAWIMGSNDLKSMAAGRMDRSGEGLTRAGQVIGMVGTILSIAIICLYMVIGVVAVLGHR